MEENNPYRGLKSYETKDSDLFFGRTSLIEKLCHTVSDRPLTVVLGASGSGKSSLVKAGLIPYLPEFFELNFVESVIRTLTYLRVFPSFFLLFQSLPLNRVYQWHSLSPIRPGESPLNSLNTVLKELGNVTTEQVNSQIFIKAITVWSEANPQTKLLLVVDQLEELITLCRNDEEKQQFLEILATLINTFPDVVRLVVTLRSDFEPQLRNTPLEPLWQAGRFVVPAMTREELRSVIEEPASAKVVYFESLDDPDKGYLVDRLIDEVAGMPGALPLLSFALSELYLKLVRRYLEAQNGGGTVERAITWKDYDALGGVTKSLTQRADEIYEELVKVDPAYEKTIRNVMLRMVAVGGELARRQVPELELQYPEPENGRVQKVLGEFLSARLLVSGTDAEGKVYIEPAHDALIRGWEKLSTWKKEEGDNLGLQRRLTPAAIEWNTVKTEDKEQVKSILSKTDSALNWLDKRLFWGENLVNQIPTQIARFLRHGQNQRGQLKNKPLQFLWDSNPSLGVLDEELSCDDNWLNQVEKEFVQESVLQKRRNISWRWRIVIAIILAISTVAVIALIQRTEAQKQSILSLVKSARANMLANQQLEAVMDAVRAERQSHNLLFGSGQIAAQISEVLAGVTNEIQERNRWQTGRGTILNVAFTDNQVLVFTTDNGMIGLLDIKDNSINIKKDAKEQTAAAAFSPDGKQLAIFTRQSIQLLDSNDGNSSGDNFPITDWVSTMVFSSDGKRLAAATVGNEFKMWDINIRQPITKCILNKLPEKISSIAFSRNDQILAMGFNDGTVKLWDVVNGCKSIHSFPSQQGAVWSMAFSPDSQLLATGGKDGTIKLWPADFSPTYMFNLSYNYKFPVATIKTNQNIVQSVAFNSDSQWLISGGKDGTIKLWKVKGYFNRTDPNDQDANNSSNGALSPDGKTLATQGDNSTVKLSDTKNSDQIPKTIYTQQGMIYNMAFSPDSKILATGGSDGTVKLWNVKNGDQIPKTIYTQDSDAVWSVAFSPDGQRLATGGNDGSAKLWNAKLPDQNKSPSVDTQPIATINTHLRKVKVAFSPDGQLLTTGSNYADKNVSEVTVWQVSGDMELLKNACNELRDYLNNKNAYINDSDRHLCDDVKK